MSGEAPDESQCVTTYTNVNDGSPEYDGQQRKKPTASGYAEQRQGTGPHERAGSLVPLGTPASCWRVALLHVVLLM